MTSPIWFVFGPSGVGKSYFGHFMEEHHRWLHLEIDRFVSFDEPIDDGIDVYDLRNPWDEFLSTARPERLVSELDQRVQAVARSGCILTFPSLVVLGDEHLAALGLSSWVLYGSAAECISAFLGRENAIQRNLDENHWIRNNAHAYLSFSLSRFQTYRVSAFTETGARRPPGEMLTEMLERSGV